MEAKEVVMLQLSVPHPTTEHPILKLSHHNYAELRVICFRK